MHSLVKMQHIQLHEYTCAHTQSFGSIYWTKGQTNEQTNKEL